MCLQITQFCSGSTKPLLLAGGILSFLLAIAIGYIGCTTNALYKDIDPNVADAKSISYYLQLATAGYLALVTLFSCYAAHYDQKHSIRALSIIATLNLMLALAAILMMPPQGTISESFKDRLKQAAEKYDRSDKGPPPPSTTTVPPVVADQNEKQANTPPGPPPNPKQRRWAADLTDKEATTIWDNLQARGCCGMTNGTTDWRPPYPKSCCANPSEEQNQKICKYIDEDHNRGCLALIDSTGLHLLIVLIAIALVNFYLATISGISAYRTFHYNEASQSAYT